MKIIGEKINSSIPSIYQAFEDDNYSYIKEIAKKQLDCGADYIDVNAGVFSDEADKLAYAIEHIISDMDAKIAIDSTNPESISYVLERVKPKGTIINSITLETKRLEGILPLVKEYNTGIIALPIDEQGIPKTTEKRVENAQKLISIFKENGIDEKNIYIDILVEAASIDWQAPLRALEAARILKERYSDIHLISGISNVSYGLPKRNYINAAFVSSAIASGVDTVIIDITNKDLKMILYASLLVNGKDEYAANYLSAYREIFD
jgi:5-methyltetrahydrofolate--homocysteine methyltransferase